jgi:hypothetical protein
MQVAKISPPPPTTTVGPTGKTESDTGGNHSDQFVLPSSDDRQLRDKPAASLMVGKRDGIWVFTWNEIMKYTVRLLAFTVTIIFGVWAAKSYNTEEVSNKLLISALTAAEQANTLSTSVLQQGIYANQLALLSLCASNQVSGLH